MTVVFFFCLCACSEREKNWGLRLVTEASGWAFHSPKTADLILYRRNFRVIDFYYFCVCVYE